MFACLAYGFWAWSLFCAFLIRFCCLTQACWQQVQSLQYHDLFWQQWNGVYSDHWMPPAGRYFGEACAIGVSISWPPLAACHCCSSFAVLRYIAKHIRGVQPLFYGLHGLRGCMKSCQNESWNLKQGYGLDLDPHKPFKTLKSGWQLVHSAGSWFASHIHTTERRLHCCRLSNWPPTTFDVPSIITQQ